VLVPEQEQVLALVAEAEAEEQAYQQSPVAQATKC
jgi:hypothetical protein